MNSILETSGIPSGIPTCQGPALTEQRNMSLGEGMSKKETQRMDQESHSQCRETVYWFTAVLYDSSTIQLHGSHLDQCIDNSIEQSIVQSTGK